MKHFQDLGHTVVYVVGAFTALIGDPTGRSKTRPPLTMEEIAANAETYKTQIFKILDPQKTVTRFNSEWLEPLGSVGWIKLAAKYNVAQMLERREFKQRYEAGKPIAMHEFLYPLAQAYDSVVLERRRRARRDRSALQPQRRPRPDAGLRSRAADRDDDAAARRARRRREDVEEPGQLRRRHRERARDVRQADVDLRRLDVEVLRAADRSRRRTTSRSGAHAVTAGTLHPKAAKVDLATRIVGDFHSPAEAAAAAAAFERGSRRARSIASSLEVRDVGAAGGAASVPAGADSAEAGGVGRARPTRS